MHCIARPLWGNQCYIWYYTHVALLHPVAGLLAYISTTYPKRNGLVKKGNHFIPIYLKPKVDNPYSVTCLIRTLIFELYVVWCASKNGYQKDMCLKEIGLHAQNMISILD